LGWLLNDTKERVVFWPKTKTELTWLGCRCTGGNNWQGCGREGGGAVQLFDNMKEVCFGQKQHGSVGACWWKQMTGTMAGVGWVWEIRCCLGQPINNVTGGVFTWLSCRHTSEHMAVVMAGVGGVVVQVGVASQLCKRKGTWGQKPRTPGLFGLVLETIQSNIWTMSVKILMTIPQWCPSADIQRIVLNS
jgi:hypothetical protein